eukprot:COSAG01_NODE_8291_length_2841_cov_1.646973_1_plen_103_part_00
MARLAGAAAEGSLSELLDAAAAKVEAEAAAAKLQAQAQRAEYQQNKLQYKQQKRLLLRATAAAQECVAVAVQWAAQGEPALASAVRRGCFGRRLVARGGRCD